MSTDRTKPDLTFVNLIHRALRADGARLVATAAALTPADRAGRLPRVHEFYGNYREQLIAHHTHLTLEEATALPLVVSEMPVTEYKKVEALARKATPKKQAGFMVPWLAENASPDQRRAWFRSVPRSVPPLRILYLLNRRRYRRLHDALLGSVSQGH